MKRTGLLVSIMLLSGCMVGPDFSAPSVKSPEAWRQSSGASQLTEHGLRPQWWRIFHDDTLTALIEQAAQANLDVQAAGARLLQAQAEYGSVTGESLPAVTGSAFYQRARNSQTGLQDISGLNGKQAYSVWQSGVGVSWELDMWGRLRRAKESSAARVEVSEDLRRAVLLSIQTETASDYFQLRRVQWQQENARQNLAVANHSLKLTTIRMADGVATQLDVAQAQAQVASVESTLPLLEQQQAHLINALSYLLGEQPGALTPRLAAIRTLPLTPPEVPVGLPSQLAQRRPDIRAAEAQLHAATADTGVATANLYPSITLSGNVGLQAMQFSKLGDWGSHLFSVGPGLTLPIFEGGRLKSQLALKKAQQQEAGIHFQSTVLKAWHEVDDAMVDYETYQRQRRQLKAMVDNDNAALTAASQQYVAGATDFLNVLTMQKELLAAQQALVMSDADVSLALVRLYKALGGGWEEDAALAEGGRILTEAL
ncbi:efflux transporter outer membrane subunit [Pseudomonas graminis]